MGASPTSSESASKSGKGTSSATQGIRRDTLLLRGITGRDAAALATMVLVLSGG